ncbi:MAG: hypothetical protein P8129_23050 [Anaerolineae bacterium]|jgi:hypothetical protein
MNQKRRVDELQDALENLLQAPGALSSDELRVRIRQVSKQAIADGDAAERAGRFEEAGGLYEVAARAFRQLAELASGDLRASELATADFWAARAELVAARTSRSLTGEESRRSAPEPRSIHTPGPIPLSPRTSIRREQSGRLSSPPAGNRRRADRFESSPRRRVGERDDQAHDSGSFRKPEDK